MGTNASDQGQFVSAETLIQELVVEFMKCEEYHYQSGCGYTPHGDYVQLHLPKELACLTMAYHPVCQQQRQAIVETIAFFAKSDAPAVNITTRVEWSKSASSTLIHGYSKVAQL